MLEVGRVCLKTAGREAGRYCVVVKSMDETFVMVTGPRELTSVKRRRCNVNHLEPLMETIKIKSDAPDSEVLKAFQQASLIDKLGMGPRIAKPAKPKVPAPRAEPPKAEPKKEEPKPAKKAPAKKAPAKRAVKPAAKKPAAKRAPAKKAKPKAAPKKAAAKKATPKKKAPAKKAPVKKPAKKK